MQNGSQRAKLMVPTYATPPVVATAGGGAADADGAAAAPDGATDGAVADGAAAVLEIFGVFTFRGVVFWPERVAVVTGAADGARGVLRDDALPRAVEGDAWMPAAVDIIDPKTPFLWSPSFRELCVGV